MQDTLGPGMDGLHLCPPDIPEWKKADSKQYQPMRGCGALGRGRRQVNWRKNLSSQIGLGEVIERCCD